MEYIDIINNLKKKIYHPIYFLMGEEGYFIDQISNFIEKNVLTETEKSFNLSVLYGQDIDIKSLITNARRYPMMANHQVIIVREAQKIKNIEELVTYVKQPLLSTILVIDYKYKPLDSRKKKVKELFKEINKKGILFNSKKLYDNQLPDWINQYLKEKKYKIGPKASVLLSEYLGTNLSKVAGELEKLIISLPKGSEITPDVIEKNIGISKDYNIFELQDAIGQRDILKVNRIINHFSSDPNTYPLPRTIVGLYFYFMKLLTYNFLKDKSQAAVKLHVHPFFIKKYASAAKQYTIRKLVQNISILREFDMKSKGIGNVSSSNEDLLKEMTFKLIH